jgi:AbiV family abortive infection protein
MNKDNFGSLNCYFGNITPKETVEGINASKRNSKRLVEDAKLLFKSERYPSAIALAILAIEEDGKATLLRNIPTASTDAEIKNVWKQFRSHRNKNGLWKFADYVNKEVKKFSEVKSLVASNSEHTKRLDQIKQACFYVDCYRKGFWSEPVKIADIQFAQLIINTAGVLVNSHEECTELEIQLWVKHQTGAAGNRFNAVANWYADMQAHGLKPPGINESKEFFSEV